MSFWRSPQARSNRQSDPRQCDGYGAPGSCPRSDWPRPDLSPAPTFIMSVQGGSRSREATQIAPGKQHRAKWLAHIHVLRRSGPKRKSASCVDRGTHNGAARLGDNLPGLPKRGAIARFCQFTCATANIVSGEKHLRQDDHVAAEGRCRLGCPTYRGKIGHLVSAHGTSLGRSGGQCDRSLARRDATPQLS
jgi:hypothetical protein